MGTIIDLAKRRLEVRERDSRKATIGINNLKDAEHYFCMRCDADNFRLYSGGAVHCAQCGSLMQNLLIGET